MSSLPSSNTDSISKTDRQATGAQPDTTPVGGQPGQSSGGGSVTSINTGTGLTGGPITTSGTIQDANTGVAAGSYTNTNLTVNAQGRITVASNGSSGFTNPMTTLGDTLYENSVPAAARLAGNTTSRRQYYSQRGTGSVSAPPTWINWFVCNVQDFGADPTGAVDATTAIQAAANALPTWGGVVYFPAGNYLITSAITVTNKPVVFRGDGPDVSVILQNSSTAATNAITFTCNLSFNVLATTLVPNGGGVICSLQVIGLSFYRGGNNGGHAIDGTWTEGTGNQEQFVCQDVKILFLQGSPTYTWAIGIQLTGCSGTRVERSSIIGNPFENTGGSPNPFTMTQGILHTGSTTTAGKIDHFMTEVTIDYAGVGVDFNGWYEGIEATNCEFVAVAIGWRFQSGGISQKPNLFLMNCHVEHRQYGIYATWLQNPRFVNCDIYNPYSPGVTGIYLSQCDNLLALGCKFYSQSTSYYGIQTVTGCNQPVIEGCVFQQMSAAPIELQNSAGGIVLGCVFNGKQVITAGSFIVGLQYTILTVGTTNFTAIGASANTIGVTFIATGVGSGSGTALGTDVHFGSGTSYCRCTQNEYNSNTSSMLNSGAGTNIMEGMNAGLQGLIRLNTSYFLGSNNEQPVNWGTAEYDDASAWSNASATQLNVPTATIRMQVSVVIRCNVSGTGGVFPPAYNGALIVKLKDNSGNIWYEAACPLDPNQPAGVSMTTPVIDVMAQGVTYFTVTAYQDSGANVQIIGAGTGGSSIGYEIIR